ncbi:MAG: restriction endonuclease, partial [Desulfobacteraceae bacterium]
MELIKVIVILAVLAAVISYSIRYRYGSRRQRLHRKNIQKAQKLKEMFRSWKPPGLEARILSYARKIDPLVFEELILSSLQDAGAKIQRNYRYTGDGGIDGVFHINGDRWFMQAKRYSSSTVPEHVMDFVRKCNGTPGIFVHTGRTGPKSYTYAKINRNIKIISGSRLVRLILNSS